MKSIRTHKKSAQTILEYSLFIAAMVGALVVMQYYFQRGAQGLFKQHVDNLGGERMTEGQYTPGSWYGASTVTRIGTSGFDYEGRKGFQVSTGTMQRSSTSRMLTTASGVDLPAQNLTYSNLANGSGEQAVINQVFGTTLDPGIEAVNNQVNNQTPQWNNNTSTVNGEDANPAAGVDSTAGTLVDDNIPENRDQVPNE